MKRRDFNRLVLHHHGAPRDANEPPQELSEELARLLGTSESDRLSQGASQRSRRPSQVGNHDQSRKTIAKVTESVDRVRSDRGQAGSVRQPRHVPP